MKFVVCLLLVVAVAAKPNPFRNGQYVITYDNSLENGRYDTSVEWVRRIGPAVGAVSVKSGTADGSLFPYYMKADSSEEIMFMLGDAKKPTTRTHTQRVDDLTRILNSGFMDRSDEFLLRAVMKNPERFGNPTYGIDNSGEVYFLPSAGGAHARPQGRPQGAYAGK